MAAHTDGDDPRLAELLLRWEELRGQGQSVSVDELCSTCPELAEELDRQIAILRRLEPPRGGTTTGDNGPHRPEAAGAPSRESATARAEFRDLRFHAAGALGDVFMARNAELYRDVALKFLKPDRASDPDSRRRFLQEAEVTGRLEHPGVVPIYALGTDASGAPCYAMRFIRGETLQHAIDAFHAAEQPGRDPSERSLALRELLNRFVSICNTVAYAHSRGILHRDLKPRNVMLGKYDETLVLDWGLAKAFKRGDAARAVGEETLTPSSGSGEDGSDTPTLGVVGTPAYMSPEQAEARWDLVGPASDVFSLGGILYAILTGRAPYTGHRGVEAMEKVKQCEFPPPRQIQPGVPRALEAVCLKAMARQTEDRYRSATDLAADVRRWLADEPVTALHEGWGPRLARWTRRNRIWVQSGTAALVLVALVAVVAAVALNASWVEEAKARRRADEQGAQALQSLKREGEARRRADASADAARHNLYLAHIRAMSLAQSAYDGGNIGRALELLEGQRPGPGRDDLRSWEWHLLWRLCHDELRTLTGHSAPISGLAYSRDGRRIATADVDGTLKVWDALTGREIWTREGLSEWPSVAFSPDGRRLVSEGRAGRIGEMLIWDVDANRELRCLEGHGQRVQMVSFGGDGRRIASAHVNGRVIVWDAEDGRELRSWLCHDNNLAAIALSPDGRWLASCGDSLRLDDPGVKLWDIETGQLVWAKRGHSDVPFSVAFSPDGRRLATAGGSEVKLWDTRDGRELRSIEASVGRVTRVAFGDEGRLIAAACGDGLVRLLEAETGREVRVLKGHTAGVREIVFGADGLRLASGGFDMAVKIWDAGTTRNPRDLLRLSAPTRSLAFSPDGRWLITSSGQMTKGGEVKLWDLASGQERWTAHAQTAWYTNVAFSPDGRSVVVRGDYEVEIRDAADGRRRQSLSGLAGYDIRSIAFSPDGRSLATAGQVSGGKPDATIWDLTTGQRRRSLGDWAHTGSVEGLAYSPDGRGLATISDEGEGIIRIWDADSGQMLRSWGAHSRSIEMLARGLAFSQDGRMLASFATGEVKLWEADTGRRLQTLKASQASGVAFSPDGRRLATAGGDGVKVWDVASGQELLAFKQDLGMAHSVAFSPDGWRLAAGGDSRVRVWDARPPTPEVRDEREALGLVDALFARPAAEVDVKARIRDDPAITDAVRRRALAFADQYREAGIGREAYALVNRLFDEVPLSAKVIERIRGDRAISEPVRQRALDLAGQFPGQPFRLNEASWSIVRTPGGAVAERRRALLLAEAAHRMRPQDWAILNTLGVARYRLEDDHGALAALERSDQLHGGEPANLAFIAMAQQRLGLGEQARSTMARLREAMKKPDRAADGELQGFLREAEAVMGKAKP
jgi:eukaryotic-like serine/threonine-protein kinase